MKKIILTIVCLLLLIISYSYFEKNDETKQKEIERKTRKNNLLPVGLISKRMIPFITSY